MTSHGESINVCTRELPFLLKEDKSLENQLVQEADSQQKVPIDYSPLSVDHMSTTCTIWFDSLEQQNIDDYFEVSSWYSDKEAMVEELQTPGQEMVDISQVVIDLFDELPFFVKDSMQVPNLPIDLGQPEGITKNDVIMIHKCKEEVETSIQFEDQSDILVSKSSMLDCQDPHYLDCRELVTLLNSCSDQMPSFEQQNDEIHSNKIPIHEKMNEGSLVVEECEVECMTQLRKEVVVVGEVVDKSEIRGNNSNFVLSMGCPIRHIIEMEDNKKVPIMVDPKHGSTVEGEKTQVTSPPQVSNDFISYQEVSKLVYVLQGVVQLSHGLSSFVIFHVVVQNHLKHQIFYRKHSYFTQLVNGFA